MNKRITHTARLSIRLTVTALFAFVFYKYYANYALQSNKSVLNVGIYVLLWYLIYRYICMTYNAFRIMSIKKSHLVLIQTISFGIADLFLYTAICAAAHGYVNIIPGAMTACAQIAAVFVIISITKKALEKYSIPKKTIFIIGNNAEERDVEACLNELKTEHSNIVNIKKTIDEETAIQTLDNIVKTYDSLILFGLSSANRDTVIKKCYVHNLEFYYTPSLPDLIMRGCSPRHITETPMMKYDFVYEKTSYQVIKRILDFIFAVILLIITLPIMAITAILIKLDGGPALFIQKRYGKDRVIFNIYKFRSMVVDADSYGVVPTGEKDPRITKVGSVIRRLRIDELPQLFNIIKGDMSFVGPRPERIEHIDEYSKELPEFLYRLKVQQGLTGYAQVYGKYNTTPYDKVRLDMQYIESQSFLTDLKIILLTIHTIFKKESTEGFSENERKRIQENCQSDDGEKL